MAALDFPNSPSVNDVFASNNRTWIWDGTVWSSSGVVGDIGPTGPTGATGDIGSTGPTGSTGEAYANIDGGSSSSTYGGITPIDGGTSE